MGNNYDQKDDFYDNYDLLDDDEELTGLSDAVVADTERLEEVEKSTIQMDSIKEGSSYDVVNQQEHLNKESLEEIDDEVFEPTAELNNIPVIQSVEEVSVEGQEDANSIDAIDTLDEDDTISSQSKEDEAVQRIVLNDDSIEEIQKGVSNNVEMDDILEDLSKRDTSLNDEYDFSKVELNPVASDTPVADEASSSSFNSSFDTNPTSLLFSQDEKKPYSEPTYQNSGSKMYIGYTTRVFLHVLAVVILCAITVIMAHQTFSVLDLENVRYKEQSNIDYKVYLNDNDFYSQDYLDKDMAYVASLIKSIKVNMSYGFNINMESNILYDYQMMGDLVIVDKETGDKVFYRNTYTLSEKKEDKLINDTSFNVGEEVSIDYWYYNGLSNKFRKNYGVDTESYLEVYFSVNEKNADNNLFHLVNSARPSIKIPLSQNSVRIELMNVDMEKRADNHAKITVTNPVKLVFSIVSLVLLVLSILKLMLLIMKTQDKKTSYDKVVGKILREYDRYIVNTTTPPNREGCKVIVVNNFEELLDARDSTNEPIKYHIVSKHNKCEFYINHHDELYILTLKAVDLEK